MFCTKCGAKISEGSKFCKKCGAPVGEIKVAGIDAAKSWESIRSETEVQSTSAGQSSGRNLAAVILLVGAAALLLAAVIGAGSFFFYREKGISESANGAIGENVAMDGNAEGGTGNAVADGENWKELTPLYSIDDVPFVNIHAQNYTPGTKVSGILWDNTLFYWLEDVDQTSQEDGYLAKCPITKMTLRNAESGNLIQYEIYRDPDSDEIYKIVSIEQTGTQLQLTDYYYQGGAPNFTFSRYDSVYTPTYATPAKIGERYYFSGDVLAKWRMIQEPEVVEEYALTLTDEYYSQYDYFSESDGVRTAYDDMELRELNAARNTYDAVMAAGDGIGLVDGRVTDTTGNPVAGVTVDILRAGDGTLLYRGVTGDDGSFRIFVYLEDVECSIVVRGDETYDSNNIQGVILAKADGGSSFGNLLMHRIDGDEYPVHIDVYAAADVRTDEEGSPLRDLLTGAKVFLRAGAGAYTGETMQILEADGDGKINTTLQAGTYTAQIDVQGYASVYVIVEVAEKETTVEGYMLPIPETNQVGIVLTWEGEADLDLTLFTPYQSTGGDMAHIGGRITDDGHGNRLVADNAAGCEVMYVNTAVMGNYKLYVNNYTESEAGNYNSAKLSALNINIYIYDSTGLIAEYSFPSGQNGVVWEVADLSGSQVTPSQRVYVSLEGKSWWTESKEKTVLVEETHYSDKLNTIWRNEYSYDTLGNMVKEIDYNDGSIVGWSEHSYDTLGNKAKYISFNSDGDITWRYEYSYDASGNLVKEIQYSSDGSIVEWHKCSYDASGNLVRETYQDSDGNINEWHEYSYDALGNIVKAIGEYPNGGYWTEYSYDTSGNKVKETYCNGDGSIFRWHEYSYDASGNLVKETHCDRDGNISGWYEYSYDASGNLVKETYCDRDGSISGWTEYSYDALGNKVKETYCDRDGSISGWIEYIYASLHTLNAN